VGWQYGYDWESHPDPKGHAIPKLRKNPACGFDTENRGTTVSDVGQRRQRTPMTEFLDHSITTSSIPPLTNTSTGRQTHTKATSFGFSMEKFTIAERDGRAARGSGIQGPSPLAAWL